MQVISRSTVKTLLGITDSTYDTAIDTHIPYIDSIVKQITKNRWNYRVVGSTTNGSTSVTLTGVVSPKYFTLGGYTTPFDDLNEYIQTGQMISGTGIPTDAYITEVYYNYPEGVVTDDDYTLQVDISEAATATGDTIAMYIGIPIAFHMNIAKGIWYRIQQVSTTLPTNSLKSRRMGPITVTFDDKDSKMDNRYGMPSWFVKGLGNEYQTGH